MTNAFEYGDALLPPANDEETKDEEPTTPRIIESNQPYLNLATYGLINDCYC